MSVQNLVHVGLTVHRAVDVLTPDLVSAAILGLVHDVSRLVLLHSRRLIEIVFHLIGLRVTYHIGLVIALTARHGLVFSDQRLIGARVRLRGFCGKEIDVH